MNRNLLYYISGHGFGHARRSAQVIRALAAADPSVSIFVRTAAPSHLFAGLPRTSVHAPRLPFDSGMAEHDALLLDVRQTLHRILDLFAHFEQTVAEELAFIRERSISLLVCDIPYLPGEIAHAAGLPCLAIGNFTWDWIYHPLLSGAPAYAGIEQRIQSMYGRMSGLLRLPFSHPAPIFKHVIDVPLVGGRSRQPQRETLVHLGLDISDPRPRILLGMRGGLPPSTLQAAVAANRDFLFLSPQSFSNVDFSDLLAISHAVVSKLGYGIVADCIANNTPILWPRRGGFREEEIFISEGPSYMRMREISGDDFRAGRWSDELHQLLAQPTSPRSMAVDGAEVCAELILESLNA